MTKFIGFQPIFFDAILRKGTGAACMAAPMFGFKIPPELSFQSIYSSLDGPDLRYSFPRFRAVAENLAMPRAL